MLHGCIPVVIQDNVDPVFATLLDWPSFSLRIAEVTCHAVPPPASLLCSLERCQHRPASAPLLQHPAGSCLQHGVPTTSKLPAVPSAVPDGAGPTQGRGTRLSAPCPQAEVHRLPELLKQVSPEEIQHKQIALAHVWRRFLYSDYPAFPASLDASRRRLAGDMDAKLWPHGSPPAAYRGQHSSDDAFGTIVQWLYHRVSEPGLRQAASEAPAAGHV